MAHVEHKRGNEGQAADVTPQGQMARGFNHYGEPVRFHGPVCILCAQRIGIGTDYLTSRKNEIVCQHCWKPE